MATKDFHYSVIQYESYWGDVKNVEKQENCCSGCNNQLTHTHLPDYKELTIRETSRCFHCEALPKRSLALIH